jgi:hypothetical protein
MNNIAAKIDWLFQKIDNPNMNILNLIISPSRNHRTIGNFPIEHLIGITSDGEPSQGSVATNL